jgi:hypothetical protein
VNRKHSDDIKWIECDIDDCEAKFKSNGELKQHKMRVHNISVKKVYCDVEDCEEFFKTNGELKNHKIYVHNIGVTWYHCDVEKCKHKSKSTYDLRKHKANIHDVGVTWHHCDVDRCQAKFKNKGDLNVHKNEKHKLSIAWHYCTICDQKFKNSKILKTHEDISHGLNITWEHCSVEGCDSKFKTKSDLRRHMANVHDIGDHPCELCICNKNFQIEWVDQHGNELKICRACFNKATGASSRIEKQMSDFLDQIPEIEPFLVGSDTSFRSMGGCSLKRPDKLYISSDLVLWIECDENQHKYTNGNYSCDEKRIMDAFDEFINKKLVVIRWNPDKYVIPDDVDEDKKTKKERLRQLKRLIIDILDDPPAEPVYIYYMYYNEDNPVVCQNIATELLY